MPGSINVAGVWKTFSPWVNVSGTWKRCSMWINVAGIWKNTSFSIDFTIGVQTDAALGSTGNTNHRRVLTATTSGGSGSFSYSWAVVSNTGAYDASIAASNLVSATLSYTSSDLEPGFSQSNVQLTVTDTTTGQILVVTKAVRIN